ncbi:MAG: hypothetical protein HKN29_11155 [Rhodothermales bacterium]|nr:hypothetical protein [Rhodothermales bacterium]
MTAVLSLATWLLAILAVLMVVVVFLRRLVAGGRRARYVAQKQRFEALVFDVISGARSAKAARREIDWGEARPFLEFLLEVRNRIEGDAVDGLRVLAAPFRAAARELSRSPRPGERALGAQLCAEFDPRSAAGLVEDESPFVVDAALLAFTRSSYQHLRAAALAQLGNLERWRHDRIVAALRQVAERDAAQVADLALDSTQVLRVRRAALDVLQLFGTREPVLGVLREIEPDVDWSPALPGDPQGPTKWAA